MDYRHHALSSTRARSGRDQCDADDVRGADTPGACVARGVLYEEWVLYVGRGCLGGGVGDCGREGAVLELGRIQGGD